MDRLSKQVTLRYASGFSDTRALSPKFLAALKKAIAEEQAPKAKDALKDALSHFEEALDSLRVAEHESEEAAKE